MFSEKSVRSSSPTFQLQTLVLTEESSPATVPEERSWQSGYSTSSSHRQEPPSSTEIQEFLISSRNVTMGVHPQQPPTALALMPLGREEDIQLLEASPPSSPNRTGARVLSQLPFFGTIGSDAVRTMQKALINLLQTATNSCGLMRASISQCHEQLEQYMRAYVPEDLPPEVTESSVIPVATLEYLPKIPAALEPTMSEKFPKERCDEVRDAYEYLNSILKLSAKDLLANAKEFLDKIEEEKQTCGEKLQLVLEVNILENLGNKEEEDIRLNSLLKKFQTEKAYIEERGEVFGEKYTILVKYFDRLFYQLGKLTYTLSEMEEKVDLLNFIDSVRNSPYLKERLFNSKSSPYSETQEGVQDTAREQALSLAEYLERLLATVVPEKSAQLNELYNKFQTSELEDNSAKSNSNKAEKSTNALSSQVLREVNSLKTLIEDITLLHPQLVQLKSDQDWLREQCNEALAMVLQSDTPVVASPMNEELEDKESENLNIVSHSTQTLKEVREYLVRLYSIVEDQYIFLKPQCDMVEFACQYTFPQGGK